MESNIFISFLNLLKIKHTRFFSSRFFNEHPHKYNLFGLSSMLSEYGVENTGLRITNKNDIRLIETPFIAHTGSEFVVVEKIFPDEIQFFERDKRIKVPLEDFFKIWTGNILVAEPGQNSVEPEYGIHFREELFNILRKISIIENKNKDFLNSLSYPIIVKGIEYIENEVIYYYKKMQFLQRHKIIKSVKKNTFYENMSKETVNEAIANTDTLVLEMTQKCNLRCLYCTYGELYNRDPFRKNADIDIKMVIKLIIFLYENFWNTDKNYSIRKRINISFYGGEPLIQFKKIKDIVELTEKLRNNKVYFSYTITTNGTLINEEIANFFVKYNFQVGISIDGNRENNSYRIFANGIEIYDKLIEKINFLKANYPNFFRENVLFMSVLHSKNSIKEINSYLRDKYNKIVSIGPLNPVGVIKEKRHLFEKMSNESFFDKSSEKLNFEKDLRSIIISYNPYIYHSIVELFLEKNKLRFPTGTCVPLKKKIFISSKGLVLPCEKIDFRYNFGNINDENEDFSKIIDNVVKTHSLHLNQIKKTCHLCYYNNVCNKCMYNFEQDRFNRFICNHFCNKQNFKESMGQIIGTVETRPDLLISILNDFRIM